ncbi:polysaccharide deacetylase family protein [Evansella sp. AB-P1]|uniref:polysaccharide deacetylase family protein n=1 Tax=Evansella sp. AB-P1 TaxID=3037653 RepID=UPI00241E31F0|nr:polysaccharide deacetylase family protein [Evansella sp. AB-P1]MDG5788999.1 polysaccharide deacetylase family protein [Evansella sp. AB-P1]
MIKKFVLQWTTFLLLLIISFSTVHNPITTSYIYELRDEAQFVMKQDDPLYVEIQNRKKEYEAEPQDAVIDKVWKAIPGYNGIAVDVQASFEEMKVTGAFQEDKLVYHQIPPKTMLKDLPPAPIYRGHGEKPMVGLMVNVAWGNDYLPTLLKIMKKYDVTSTFFLDGSWVKNNPNLAKMIVEEGHEIGNHAYNHPNMKNLSRNQINQQIGKTNDIIETTIDVKPLWFAPPSGSYRQEVVDVAHEYGMHTVLWTVDTVDWKNPDPVSMAQRVIAKSDNGSLLLMHPTKSTAEGLEAMIEGIQEKELQLGPLSEVLNEKRIMK